MSSKPQAQKSGFKLCALGSKVWSRILEIICACDGGINSACRGRGLSMHSTCRGRGLSSPAVNSMLCEHVIA